MKVTKLLLYCLILAGIVAFISTPAPTPTMPQHRCAGESANWRNSMAKNKMVDLRDHLFETIEALKDTENPMEIERAKAVSQVAQTIIESVKVQLKFAEIIGQEYKDDFFGKPAIEPTAAGRTLITDGKR